MATNVNLTMRENNDEIVDITLTAVGSANLAVINGLEFIMKPSTCDADTGPDVLTLTLGDGIVINSQSVSELTATVTIPRAALARPYSRAWRLDNLTGTILHNQSNVIKVSTTKVGRQDLISIVSGTGQIRPTTYVNVGANVMGRVTRFSSLSRWWPQMDP